VKLLRALQERQFERVGGRRTITVDVRLVAATNRDLEAAVQAGQFRLDLYHRLQVIELLLPPLRQRREDVALLAGHFLAELGAEHGREILLAPGTLDALAAAPWPGNVRQLRNVLERLVVSHPGPRVAPADLEPILGTGPATPAAEPAPVAPVVADGERERVSAALIKAGHVQARAARLLGMSVRQLAYRVRKYGIEVERF
jgi:Nif-specific regulatory protein